MNRTRFAVTAHDTAGEPLGATLWCNADQVPHSSYWLSQQYPGAIITVDEEKLEV